MTDRVTLSNPRFSPVPAARVADPSLQRVHDALKEVVETIRGTRGDPLDRAVFLRDLVETGILKRFGSGQIGIGPAIPGEDDLTIDPTVPPALTNIIATAGFSYVLLTWNDPQFRSLAYYEVWRRQVADPTQAPSYTADDARITLSEQTERAGLLAMSSRTPQQTRLMQALGALQFSTEVYDYAKATHLLYPEDAELEQAYIDAGNELKADRMDVEIARADDDSSATLIARTVAPVLSDPVDRGTTYIYWVRAVSTSGVVGPFNENGVSATTQPDISGIIDELTDEANRGPVADFIFNGLDVPGSPGESLLELLDTLQELAEQADQNASDALSAVVSGIPPSIWQAIHDLYNALASTVLGTVIKRYEVSVDVAALQDRVATAETTVLNQADDIAALSGEITTFSTQYDSQFAQVNSAIVALSDADSAFALDINGLEGAVYDPQLGVLAAHSRVDDVLNLSVTADSALGQKFTTLEAEVDDASGKVADILSLQLSPTSALGARLTEINLALDDLNGSVSDLLALSISDESALAQRLTAFNLGLGNVAGSVRDILNLAIDPTSALAQSLRALEASVGAAQGGVQDLLTLSIAEDSLLALKLSQLTGSVGSAAGQIKDILDLSISPTSALATKLSSLEATVGTSAGQIEDILSLQVTGDSALVGKLTELDAETTYATGAIESMLTLDLTSTEVANTAFAGAMQKIDLVLGDVGSTLETAVYNQITDLKAAGEFDDPVARAGWGVRIQQTAGGENYVSGFGIAQQLYEDPDGTYNAYSEFVVAADKFVILDPSNPDKTKNSPFIVAADPDTGEMKVWIRAAMIQKAAIQELIAGSIVADAIRANAFVQTGYLATPIINVGTWTQTVPGDPFSWVYDAGTGRQGNFSVDSNGVMHARYAVLESLTVKTPDGKIFMGSGDGSYTSVGIVNTDITLTNTNGVYSLNNAGESVTITADGLGVRPLAQTNVNNWNTSRTNAPVPTSAVHLHIRVDRASQLVYVHLRGTSADVPSTTCKFSLQVIGATVTNWTSDGLESGEVPTATGTAIDFATATGTVWGTNGFTALSAGWTVSAAGYDGGYLTLSGLDANTEFRLRITDYSGTSRKMVTFGDCVAVAEFFNPPLVFHFFARDGSDYDALLMTNGPEDADATRGAPAGTFVNGIAVETITAAVEDFNASNNRNADAIATTPFIANNANAVEHTANADGTVNVSLDWSWTGTEANIDGFFVYVRRVGAAVGSPPPAAAAYTWGTDAANEVVYQAPASKRAFILYGVPANNRYYFGVRAYRKVDSDVTGPNVVNGIVANPLMSAQPITPQFSTAVNGYLPSAVVAFAGDIVGTLATEDLNVWSSITGTGKPQDGATVGADWNSNVTNIPYADIVKNDDASALGFNPAFAAWADAAFPPDGWSMYGSGGTLIRDTDNAQLGPYCVRMDVSGGDYGLQRTVTFPSPLPAGTYISGSVDIRWAWRSSGIPSLLVSVTYDDGSSQYTTGTNGYVNHVAPPTSPTATWFRLPWAVHPSNRTKRMTGMTVYLLASNAFLGVPFVGRAFFDSFQFAFFGNENAVVGTNNPITSANIGTYIANLAVGTLHIGANTVTVPAAATWTGTLQLNNTTWTDIVSVNLNIPTTGVSSIDNNIPVLINWSTEAAVQNSNNQIRQWRIIRVLAGVTTNLNTTSGTALDLEHFAGGNYLSLVSAGNAYTFKLQGLGVAGVNVWKGSLWIQAARR